MTNASPAARLWDQLTPRQRIARLLLVLSEMTPQGTPSEGTLGAAAEGVGAFHGAPMLGSGLPDRPSLARTFNDELRRSATRRFGIAPLIGANAECGLAYSLGRGGIDVPYPAALGEVPPQISYDVGRQVGLDVAACGYDWCFQPVVDVRVSRDDPVIGVRTFGAQPSVVGSRAVAFLHGVQSTGVLATAKHFPGHGDASVDSHLGLPVVERDEATHSQIHLAPYRAVVDAGVAAIMTAHVVLPGLGLSEIATFSPELNRDLLRDDLGFRGVLVSDSLRMRAVAARYSRPDAVLRSLSAGCDVANIKCPPGDVPGLLDELEAALSGGRLAEADLYRAFDRVVAATQRRIEDGGEVVLDGRGRFDAAELDDVIGVSDARGALPVPVTGSGAVGVVVDEAATFAEPLDGALQDLSRLLGARLVLVPGGGAPPADVEALVVISRGQAGPSAEELSLVRAAENHELPAAVLLAGPKDVADRCPTSLPTVQAPCIDVFGLVSRSTAYSAFRALLGPAGRSGTPA